MEQSTQYNSKEVFAKMAENFLVEERVGMQNAYKEGYHDGHKDRKRDYLKLLEND